MAPLTGCDVLKMYHIKKVLHKFLYYGSFYEAKYIYYLYLGRLFCPLVSEFLPAAHSHVLTETCWSVPGSQQLKPVEREIPS